MRQLLKFELYKIFKQRTIYLTFFFSSYLQRVLLTITRPAGKKTCIESGKAS